MNLITFLSDFGQKEGYAGSVKGIMLSINPKAQVVDISHMIQPYQIEQGAYILASYYQEFPRKTVHLAVVDPGVGGERLPLILKTSRYFFVGPDNGIFTYVMHKEAYQAYRIDPLRLKQQRLNLQNSSTFQARDIFGPVAALLSKGQSDLLARLADPLEHVPQMLADPVCRDQQIIRARVILIDHFGNIIIACAQNQLAANKTGKIISIKIKDRLLSSVHHTYSDVPPGSLLALWNSAGFLEIAVNQGNAAEVLGCSAGLDYVDIVLE
jgi:S-adenosylmethionine hydrolase